MDFNDPNWFGQIKRNSKEHNFEGSLGEVIRQISLHIHRTELPITGRETRYFQIWIQDRPITADFIDRTKLIDEVNAGIIDSTESPYDIKPDESYDLYINRLIEAENCPETFARNMANQMFGRDKDSLFAKYESDPLAQSYRRMSASLEAFKEASPGDYSIAKEHVRINYPEYFINITPRI